MTKKFKDLQEAIGALVKNYMEPASLRELKMQARQLSAAFQPTIEDVLKQIEAKLNFFGYTFGALEDMEDEDTGDEELFILTHVDGEIVRNALITLKWSKLASGQQAPMGINRQGQSALRFDVKIDIKEISPEEMQSKVDQVLIANQSGGLDFFNPDENSDAEQNVQESKK